MKGKKIKQINNLTIRYTEAYQYAVWTPDGICWEDRMTLAQAEEFCKNTNDFLVKKDSRVKGIKAKDIRDFEKYAKKLNDVVSRIREYKPEANAFLVCGTQTYLCLMSDDHCNYDKYVKQNLVVTEIDMIGFDGGDW